ncbi:MAG: DUF4129 domain-containing protein [Caldilineales bacterium]|nr:DUF4129 domain-containing protein [Caldilineales bacterium]MDW8316490.1 DUF4129 domain-containing protein [Anaerolineae bacterium]
MTNAAWPWAGPPAAAVGWRREALYLACGVMEVCWLTPLFLLAVGPARAMPLLRTALVLAGLLLLFFYLARLADRWEEHPWRVRLVLGAALLAAILAAWRAFLPSAHGLGNPAWLREALAGLLLGGGGGHWMAALSVLVLWWRGISLSRRSLGFQPVALAFRGGVLALAVGAAVLELLVGRQVHFLIYLFFLCGLAAVALARMEEVGVGGGPHGRSFEAFWTALVAVGAAALVALGSLWAALASPAGRELVGRLWAPIGNALLVAVLALVTLLLAPFEPLLERLAAALSGLWRALLSPELAQALAGLAQEPPDQTTSPLAVYLAAAGVALRLLCGASLLLALALAGAWLLRQRQEQRAQPMADYEAVERGPADTLQDLLAAGQDRLRSALAALRSLRSGPDLLAAVSVRAIYANTVRLAAARGYPRPPARTPYEHLPALLAAFPGREAEVRLITDAYVAVHYGERPATRQEVAALRAAFERLAESR